MSQQSVLLSGQVIPLDNGGHRRNVLLIGSNPQSDIKIPLSGVSWQHARILKSEDGEYYLEDLNSTNGTWLVAMKVSKEGLKTREEVELEPKKLYKLNSGDHVIFGDIEVTFTFVEHYESTGEVYLHEILNNEAKRVLEDAEDRMMVDYNEPKSFISQIISKFVSGFKKE